MKEFGDIEIEGFKRTGGKKKYRTRTLTKIEKDGNWDEAAMSASDNSWKDEAWTLTFIAIILASFIPALQPFMKQGFIFLKNDCPDWISYGILASIAGSFGLKSIAQFRK